MSPKSSLSLVIVALICTFGAIEGSEASAQTKEAAAIDKPSKKVDPVVSKTTDRSDPDYVRCRSEPVIGSRVRKKRTCMTNRKWEEYARSGNTNARSMLDDIAE